MNEWKMDKRWSDRFLPEIKGILGLHLIGEAPVEEDVERNTDLIVLRMDAVRIACRVRRFKFLNRYGEQFTIRSKRYSGNKTELSKIIEGWGQYMFYAFANSKEEGLARWILIDLNVFRLWFSRELVKLSGGKTPGIIQRNTDKSSEFIAFLLADMPEHMCVATNGP